MSDDPIYFVVQRSNGREVPAVIHGPIPAYLRRKVTEFEEPPLIYVLRLDTYFSGKALQWWLEQPISYLYSHYRTLRSLNKLPMNKGETWKL